MFRLVAATLAGSKSTVQEPAFMNVRVDDLKALPLEQRIKLVEDLWDSIAADLEKQPVSEDVKSEMRRRRDEYVKDPSTAVDWEKTRDRLGKRK
jgi:putative addiction module component (TIGR02574 family)